MLACAVASVTFASSAIAEQAAAPEEPATQPSADAIAPTEAIEGSPVARALFEEGLALYQAESWEAACAKLAESQRVEASVRTLGLLASCQEKRGLVATAWRGYVDAAVLAAERADDLGAVARERAFALEARVPRLVIQVKDEPGLVVRCDGKQVSREDLASMLYLDPGRVEIVVTLQGRETFRTTALLEESKKTIVVVPVERGPVAPKPLPPEVAAIDPLVPLGIAVAVLGLGSIGVGAGFGAAAKDANDESILIQDTCSGASCDAGRALREDAQTYATISTATIVSGLIAAAGGTVMFAVALSDASDAESAPSPAPTLAFGLGHARLEGSW